MSIAPIKPGGWDEEDPLTHDEVNDFQDKLIQAGDDHDTLEASVTFLDEEVDQLQVLQAANAARFAALEQMAFRPDLHVDFVEDFLGAIYDASESRLDGQLPWRTGGSGTVSVNNREGNTLHPGLLEVAIPGDGSGDVTFHFALIGASESPIAFSKIKSATFVMKIVDNASNLNTSMRLGFISDNALFNGGDDAITIYRIRGLSATNWYLGRRNAGVAATAVLLGSQAVGLFTVIRFEKNESNGLDVFFGTNQVTPVATITQAQLPIVLCTFGAHMLTSSADSFVFTPSIDLMAFRLDLDGRHGT